VVEAAGGQSLRDHFAEHILGPLGMTSTSFLLDDAQRERCVPIHLRGEDGAWAASDIDWSQQPEWWAGGHGLYSTPNDYLRFQRMLLNGGTLDGAQILSRATVEAAFRNQIGELEFPAEIATADPGSTADFVAGPGLKWGLGLLLNPEDQPGMRAAGSGAWAGLFNTHFWVDPASGVTGAIYTQSLPFVEPRVYALYPAFEQALYASLAEEPVDRRFTREAAPVEEQV
jgi:CubicO group peptidase (beta-lactamase class C family)